MKKKKQSKKFLISGILAIILVLGSVAVFAETNYVLTLYRLRYSKTTDSVMKDGVPRKSGVVFMDTTTNSYARIYVTLFNSSGTAVTSPLLTTSAAGQMVEPIYTSSYQNEQFAAYLGMIPYSDDSFFTIGGQWTPNGQLK